MFPGSTILQDGDFEDDVPVHECSDPAHRALGHDWTAPNGRRICGECHPPAHSNLVARRAA